MEVLRHLASRGYARLGFGAEAGAEARPWRAVAALRAEAVALVAGKAPEALGLGDGVGEPQVRTKTIERSTMRF